MGGKYFSSVGLRALRVIANAVRLNGASGRGFACHIMEGVEVGGSGLSSALSLRAKSLSFQKPAMVMWGRPVESVT